MDNRREIDLILTAFRHGDNIVVKNTIKSMHTFDLSISIDLMTYDEKCKFIQTFSDDILEANISSFENHIINLIAKIVGYKKLASALNMYDSSDAVYVIEALHEKQRELLLYHSSIKLKQEFAEITSFDEKSVGRYFNRNIIHAKPYWTVKKTITIIKHLNNSSKIHNEIYVVDNEKKPIGKISIKDLFYVNDIYVNLESIMESKIFIVNVNEDMEDASRDFVHYDLTTAAVIDNSGKLRGMLSIQEALESIDEESEEEILNISGLIKDDEHLGELTASFIRVPWVMGAIISGVMTGLIIKYFGDITAEFTSLMAAVPMIASASGNVGMQAMGSTFREDEYTSKFRLIIREIKIGFCSAIILATIISLSCLLFIGIDKKIIPSIFIASSLSIAIGGSLGVIVPLLFDYIKINPTIASSSVIIGIIDVISIMILFVISLLIINLI